MKGEEAEEEVREKLENFDYERFQKKYREIIGRASYLELSEDALQLLGGVIGQLERCDSIHIETRKQILKNALDAIKVERDGFKSQYGENQK